MWNRDVELERELRAARPEPADEFLHSVAASVGERRTGRAARLAFASATTALLLVPFAALGGFSAIADAAKDKSKPKSTPAASGSSNNSNANANSNSPAKKQYGQQKVTICHKPGTRAEKTKQVPQSAVAGHQGHGDTLGPCT